MDAGSQLKKLGFERNPVSSAAYEALWNQGQAVTRSSLRALIRDLGQLVAAVGGNAEEKGLRALAGLLAAARTSGVEVDPSSLIRAARLWGSEAGFPGWSSLLAGLRAAGLSEEARKLERFEWDRAVLDAETLRTAFERSGSFAESRWREGAEPPEDLKWELLKLAKRLRLGGTEGAGRSGEERRLGLLLLVERILGRIRELQRSFDLAPNSFRIRTEVPGTAGQDLAMAVTGRRGDDGGNPVSATLRLSSGGRLQVDLLVRGNKVEADIRAGGKLAAKLDSRKGELERALRAKGLIPGRIQVSSEGA